MAKSEILKAIEQICEEKGISTESVIETIEAALAVAYRKDFGEKNQNIKVEFNPETAGARVFDTKEVVEDPPPEEEKSEEDGEKDEKSAKENKKDAPDKQKPKKEEKEDDKKKDKKDKEKTKEAEDGSEEAEDEEEEEKRFNPKTQLGITSAKEIKKTAKIGDEIKTELFPPDSYGRMAAQTAKQVIIQKLREAERDMIFQDYKGREGEIINGAIQRVEGRVVLVELGNTTGIMLPQEQVANENYVPGQRVKVYLVSVNKTTKGPEIIVSRSHPEMVKKLFTLEVPEIASGTIEIKAVAREAGSRSKISVESKDQNIDPVGSCVGQRGARVQTIISELGGEKIDIIEYNEDPVKYIINSLSPAKILSVTLDEEEKRAKAEVKEDQLSLAIGKSGQNVRLSAKLTGWRIDVVKEGEEKTEDEAATSSKGEESEDKNGEEKRASDKKEAKEKSEEKDDPKDKKTEQKKNEESDDKKEEKDEKAKEKKEKSPKDEKEKSKNDEKNKSKDKEEK